MFLGQKFMLVLQCISAEPIAPPTEIQDLCCVFAHVATEEI